MTSEMEEDCSREVLARRQKKVFRGEAVFRRGSSFHSADAGGCAQVYVNHSHAVSVMACSI